VDGFYSEGNFSVQIEQIVETIESMCKIQRCFSDRRRWYLRY